MKSSLLQQQQQQQHQGEEQQNHLPGKHALVETPHLSGEELSVPSEGRNSNSNTPPQIPSRTSSSTVIETDAEVENKRCRSVAKSRASSLSSEVLYDNTCYTLRPE